MIDYLKKFRLDNKTAFVVGGLGLIGKEVCTAYAKAGAKTIALDLDLENRVAFEEKIHGAGYKLNFRPFDCTRMKHLEQNFLELTREFGTPDIFINCSYPRTPDWNRSSFRELTLASFQKNVDIHMNSYIWLARLTAEAMVSRGNDGSIIQLGSIYGIVGQDPLIYEGTDMRENATYSAIKGGITSFTRQMASYYGRYNIRVNTLCPGGLKGHVAGKCETQNLDFVKQYSKKTPLKRLGEVEEVASVALFLASNAASYITGATIMVDGGWSAI